MHDFLRAHDLARSEWSVQGVLAARLHIFKLIPQNISYDFYHDFVSIGDRNVRNQDLQRMATMRLRMKA